jgi:hypothetical protein
MKFIGLCVSYYTRTSCRDIVADRAENLKKFHETGLPEHGAALPASDRSRSKSIYHVDEVTEAAERKGWTAPFSNCHS